MSRLWYVPSALIVLLIGLGFGGAALEMLSPAQGWLSFSLGLVLSIVLLPFCAGAAAFASATGRPWRGAAVRGAIVPLLVVGGIVFPNLSRLRPVIHDITTDPQDRLEFSSDVPPDRSLLPRPQVLAQQREAYPDLEPVRLDTDRESGFKLALEAARDMPLWEIVSQDPETGRIEVRAQSPWFHFVDDVVIQVEARYGGVVVNMRSRSRVGESDLGANAARIRAYSEELRKLAS